jgi:hypothetical protein
MSVAFRSSFIQPLLACLKIALNAPLSGPNGEDKDKREDPKHAISRNQIDGHCQLLAW